jgi:hypothetical protein
MAKTYGNPHTLAPKQCSTNTATWTDNTITANSTKVRQVHLAELRTQIQNEFTRRGLGTITWTDPTLTADSSKIRKVHIDELRANINLAKRGDCAADTYYCPQDSNGVATSFTFTDPTITANSTKARAVHITEMRADIAAMKVACVCEAEQCQYCSDCGYHYQYCSHAGVACDNHKYSECHHTMVDVWNCSSINMASNAPNPYKSDGVAWDGTVPWTMCNYAPPGSNWGACEYQGGHNHTAWNCKCNPYSW